MNREEWIVAIRLRQLGDVLASLDTLRTLKAHCPSRRIAYVVDPPFHEVLGGVSFIDRVVTPPRARDPVSWARFFAALRALRPTWALDFHGSARSALIAVACGARRRVGFDVRARAIAYTIREARGEFRDGVRVPHTPLVWGARLARHPGAASPGVLPPRILVDEAARSSGRSALIAAGVDAPAIEARRVVGVNPGRPVATKSWPATRFAALARSIVGAGGRVVVLWGPGEEAVARSVTSSAGAGATLAPRLALRDMPGVLVNLAALVTIDSGLKHLAVCLRVPTVTLFGSTDPREWHMGGKQDVFLWRGLSCSPCRRLECPFGAPCMDVGDDAVLAALAALAPVTGWAA